MNIDKEILLNDFAIKSFRDTADLDYIAGRLAYQNRLMSQAMWSSLQAIEKYFKCILLLNRINIKNNNLGHDIEEALKVIEEKVPFSITFFASTLEYIKHLNMYGRYRYFEVSYYSNSEELIWLDQTVWQIRRYCQTLNQEVKLKNGEKITSLKCSPILGKLEKIIEDKKHPARKWLIKQNACFGTRRRKLVTIDNYFQSANPPLMLNPQIIEEIFDLGYMPERIVKAYRIAYTSNQLPI